MSGKWQRVMRKRELEGSECGFDPRLSFDDYLNLIKASINGEDDGFTSTIARDEAIDSSSVSSSGNLIWMITEKAALSRVFEYKIKLTAVAIEAGEKYGKLEEKLKECEKAMIQLSEENDALKVEVSRLRSLLSEKDEALEKAEARASASRRSAAVSRATRTIAKKKKKKHRFDPALCSTMIFLRDGCKSASNNSGLAAIPQQAFTSETLSEGVHKFTVYVEILDSSIFTSGRIGVGVIDASCSSTKGKMTMYYNNGTKLDGKWGGSYYSYGGKYGRGDTISCEVDLDRGNVRFARNGSWIGYAGYNVDYSCRFRVVLMCARVRIVDE